MNGSEKASLHMRKDYREFIMLAIIYLGGEVDDGQVFNFQAPGASHYARWMSRIVLNFKDIFIEIPTAEIKSGN